MAQAHTTEQLINRAAALLGKYVPGEALGAVEHDTIDQSIDDVLTEIEKIVSVPDRNEIPNMYFETISRMVAIYSAAAFSNTPLDLAAMQQHEMRLRYLVANSPTFEILKTNYF